MIQAVSVARICSVGGRPVGTCTPGRYHLDLGADRTAFTYAAKNRGPSKRFEKPHLNSTDDFAAGNIREQRDEGRQELAFNARPFVLCGLPLRRLPADKLLYTRRNGKFFLQVLGHTQFGLPYGQDRLIPIWVATIAVRQRSRVVRFGAPSEILDFFRLFKDGKRYRRLMEGFQRVFGATLLFGTNNEPGRELVLDWARFHFFDHLHLWFHKTGAEPAHSSNH
jgi:hypothetical protein